MPRIRMEFTKGDPVRFLSHLDIVKTFERAIRRAGIPIAFSEGFNPHPRMSFASALAVGVTSECEYIDIDLAQEMETGEVIRRLQAALPDGITVKAGRRVPENSPSLMAEVNRGRYEIYADIAGSVDEETLNSKIEEFMGREEIVIMKRTKKGPRPKNIRPGIISLKAAKEGDRIKFTLETAVGDEKNVRPEEVICAFQENSGLPLDCDTLYIKRVGLYIVKKRRLISPLDN